MVRLVVHVIGSKPRTGQEASLAKIESDRFDPDHLDVQIRQALDSACRSVRGTALGVLNSWQPDVSVVLAADEEYVRPSLHLSTETLQLLVEVGASFDFDPYV